MEDIYNGRGVIYKLTSPSEKIYIGQSICFNNRLKQYNSKNCKSIGKYLKAAIDKYDFNNFKIEILESVDLTLDIEKTKDILNELEITYISKYDSIAPKGYNLTGGGKGSFKRIVSEETRKRLSLANKGKNIVEEIQCICGFCKKEFYLKPSILKRRFKKSKQNIIACSLNCSSKYNSPLHQKRLKCGMEKVIVSVVSYATDAGLSPAPATNDRYISTILNFKK